MYYSTNKTPSNNYSWGTFYIIVGIVLLIVFVGDWLLKLALALFAISVINHGLRLRGLPSVQSVIHILLNMMAW